MRTGSHGSEGADRSEGVDGSDSPRALTGSDVPTCRRADIPMYRRVSATVAGTTVGSGWVSGRWNVSGPDTPGDPGAVSRMNVERRGAGAPAGGGSARRAGAGMEVVSGETRRGHSGCGHSAPITGVRLVVPGRGRARMQSSLRPRAPAHSSPELNVGRVRERIHRWRNPSPSPSIQKHGDRLPSYAPTSPSRIAITRRDRLMCFCGARPGTTTTRNALL